MNALNRLKRFADVVTVNRTNDALTFFNVEVAERVAKIANGRKMDVKIHRLGRCTTIKIYA